MGRVSGFVLRAPGEPTLYLAGDTVWCRPVDEALHRYRPDVTVVNAGGACFAAGDPITMTAADVAQVCREAPATQVVAVHMDAINHCHLTRETLRAALAAQGFERRVFIPDDGEVIAFA
jgi:L-ascorbate metabolism protein UlaG (beta-lactamase superfamily)